MPSELLVLGRLEFFGQDGRALNGVLAQPKRLALLAYLALARPPRLHQRDSLLAMFWPDLNEEHARGALNQALTVLRRELGTEAIVTRGRDEVGVNRAEVASDAQRFEDAVARGDGESALAAYGGELLDGLHVAGAADFDQWLEQERRRFRERAAQCALTLVKGAAEAGDRVRALEWADRGASILPHDEAMTQERVLVHHRFGDDAGALAAYDAFARRLVADLELEPSAELRAIVDDIRESRRSSAVVADPAGHHRNHVPGTFARLVVEQMERPTEPRVPAAERAKGRRWNTATIVAAGALVVVASGAWFLSSRSSPALALGKQHQVTSDPGLEIEPAISPDGRMVAYAAGNSYRMRIFIRPVGGGRTIALSDDSATVETYPRWSPDGSRLLFLANGGVSVGPVLGGSSRALVSPSADAPVSSACWSPDGKEIAFVRSDTLLVLPADGSPPRVLAHVHDLHQCSWSSDGRWVACVAGNPLVMALGPVFGNLVPSALVTIPSSGGSPQVLAEPTSSNLSPVWSTNGNRLFFVSNRDGARDIYALDITSSGRAMGAPVRLTTGLGALTISVSRDNRSLAYEVYSATANLWSLPVPQGAPTSTEAARPVTSGTQVIITVRMSPDGRWVVYDSDLLGIGHIWRVPVEGGVPEQLTDGPAWEACPNVSPDGRWVAYHSFRSGTRDVEVKSLDGSEVQRVTSTPAQESYPAWSPDGTTLAFLNQLAPFPVYLTSRDAAGRWSAPRLLANHLSVPDWSPDGRSIVALGRGDTAGLSVAVVPVEGGRRRIVYFARSGTEPQPERPQWSRDGSTIFFKSHDTRGRASLWSIGAEGGRPRLLVHFDDLNRPSFRSDFATDGKRFYFSFQDRRSDVWIAEIIHR